MHRAQVKVVLLGPNDSHDALISRLLGCEEMTIRPWLVFNYVLRARSYSR